MAELIQRDDSLNTGREKLNEAIKASDRAEGKSDTAVSTAGQARQIAQTAEDKADNVQEQFNQIVIEGDSSVEAAQARVRADGTTFTTLRDRLNSSDQDLAQTANKLDTDSIYAGSYGVEAGDNPENTTALTTAISETVGKKLTLPSGQIKISELMRIQTDKNIMIKGKNTELIINQEDLSASTNTILSFVNTTKKSKAINRTIPKGTQEVLLDSVDEVFVGDGIVIKSYEVYAERRGQGYNYHKGFATKILKIDGLTVTLKDPVPYDFNVGYDLRCDIYKPLKIYLKDITIKVIGDSAETSPFHFEGFFGGKIEDSTGKNATISHLYFKDCYGLKLDDIDVEGNLTGNIGLNYGVYLQNCHKFNISRMRATTLRHCIAMTGEPSTGIIIDDSDLTSINGSPVDSHSSFSHIVNNSILRGMIRLGLGSSLYTHCDIYSQTDVQTVVSVREDASAFLGKTKFYKCNLHNESVGNYNKYIFYMGDASYIDFIESIEFDECEFYSKHPLQSVITFNRLGKGEDIDKISIENSKFYAEVNLSLELLNPIYTPVESNENKGEFIVVGNKYYEDSRATATQGVGALFSRVELDHNEGYKRLQVVVDGLDRARPHGKVSMNHNKSPLGHIQAGRVGNFVESNDNEFDDPDVNFSFSNNLDQRFLNNRIAAMFRIGATPSEYNTVIGWNRNINGQTEIYDLLPASHINLEKLDVT